jgi:hypothetical protein
LAGCEHVSIEELLELTECGYVELSSGFELFVLELPEYNAKDTTIVNKNLLNVRNLIQLTILRLSGKTTAVITSNPD